MLHSPVQQVPAGGTWCERLGGMRVEYFFTRLSYIVACAPFMRVELEYLAIACVLHF